MTTKRSSCTTRTRQIFS